MKLGPRIAAQVPIYQTLAYPCEIGHSLARKAEDSGLSRPFGCCLNHSKDSIVYGHIDDTTVTFDKGSSTVVSEYY